MPGSPFLAAMEIRSKIRILCVRPRRPFFNPVGVQKRKPLLTTHHRNPKDEHAVHDHRVHNNSGLKMESTEDLRTFCVSWLDLDASPGIYGGQFPVTKTAMRGAVKQRCVESHSVFQRFNGCISSAVAARTCRLQNNYSPVA